MQMHKQRTAASADLACISGRLRKSLPSVVVFLHLWDHRKL